MCSSLKSYTCKHIHTHKSNIKAKYNGNGRMVTIAKCCFEFYSLEPKSNDGATTCFMGGEKKRIKEKQGSTRPCNAPMLQT